MQMDDIRGKYQDGAVLEMKLSNSSSFLRMPGMKKFLAEQLDGCSIENAETMHGKIYCR